MNPNIDIKNISDVEDVLKTILNSKDEQKIKKIYNLLSDNSIWNKVASRADFLARSGDDLYGLTKKQRLLLW